ncbi:uncharacterized protein B0I36DRAFT_322318 [Microdochium trichocladiopsis]|uniref:Proline dehydrogenase n=1 Tax=Microdochium trichocladiopsis TaxID=1682393 RepID=A0A9P9BQ99_9PEZI|nr:uncharacterized protein B0I36DRAFT_322318 [Microdochium trichocladiopsis]KAH7030722.1 hypothetical protein B0I36DRAFT_322318 [Microdochium trichocladiopsis]
MITRKVKPLSANVLWSTLHNRSSVAYLHNNIQRRHYSSGKRNVHVSTAAATTAAAQHETNPYPQTATTARSHAAATTKKSSRPLSRLPMGMLLRSLLIATVSSHRFLLLPSLSILQFLTQRSHSSRLLSVDKNPVIHGILKATFYNQFCAGETGQETRQTVRNLKDLGFRGVILTYARETMFDHRTQAQLAHFDSASSSSSSSSADAAAAAHDADIEDWRRGTMETAALVEDGDFLAVK